MSGLESPQSAGGMCCTMRVSVKPVLILCLLWLASCASQQVAPGPAVAGVDGTPPPVPLPDGRSSGSPDAVAEAPPEPEPRPTTAEADPARAPDDATVLAPVAPVRSFPDLVGLSGVEVRAAMGTPDRISDRPPARIWRYELSGCSLDLFLFPDVSSGASKALTWSTLPKAPVGSEDLDPRCAKVTADG